MNAPQSLPSLDQALDELDAVEKRHGENLRTAQTRQALSLNESIARNDDVIRRYYRGLSEKQMYVVIYGSGEMPWALPLYLPPYLIDLMLASARVLLALVRHHLKTDGPDYLLRRVPEGWLTQEMAAALHRYYLTTEPDLAFDVLVHGANAPRGTTFDDFKKAGDHLHAKLLEAQSVDTYYGWMRQCVRLARRSGAFDDAVFTTMTSGNRPLTDEALDQQVRATYTCGVENHPERIVFLEIEPQSQPSSQNLELLTRFLGGDGVEGRPVLCDPRDLYFHDDRLYYRRQDRPVRVEKIISRVVDPDLKKYVRNMIAAGRADVVERLKKIYADLPLWPDLSKHLAGYYLIDKSSLTELSLLNQVSMAPKTWIITESHMKAYRRDQKLLKDLVIKPLHGMSSKGVVVAPTLEVLEKCFREETMLAQELLRATPVAPNINHELTDPDALAGVCSETRLMIHAGSAGVPQSPHQARCVLVLSRSHYTSRDPARKIKDDAIGRGWFSNMGAIMAVKGELGIIEKRNAGLGMCPVCWTN